MAAQHMVCDLCSSLGSERRLTLGAVGLGKEEMVLVGKDWVLVRIPLGKGGNALVWVVKDWAEVREKEAAGGAWEEGGLGE